MYRTAENFAILQFEFNAFVDVNNKKKIHEQFKAFELHLKTTMLQTKSFDIKGKHVLF